MHILNLQAPFTCWCRRICENVMIKNQSVSFNFQSKREIKSTRTLCVHRLLISHLFVRSSPLHSDSWTNASLKGFLRWAADHFIDIRERWPGLCAQYQRAVIHLKKISTRDKILLWTSRMWSVSAELISLWKAAVITAPLARSCSHHAQGAPSACSSWEKRLTRHFRWADYSIGPPVNGHSQDTSQCHSTSAHSDAFRYGTQRLIDYHPASY